MACLPQAITHLAVDGGVGDIEEGDGLWAKIVQKIGKAAAVRAEGEDLEGTEREAVSEAEVLGGVIIEAVLGGRWRRYTVAPR
ncbi:hypothetical protein FOZ62_021241 [Perkinsus olseni]|uniref:Uncharacterized protein n=1 Tax=Perkinsus olseni TaxID=32597 RepID=A0A7J6PYQ0_PEROL|nr:hypothetical protein FOZ62_021241 [Perkinsus olseni]